MPIEKGEMHNQTQPAFLRAPAPTCNSKTETELREGRDLSLKCFSENPVIWVQRSGIA